MKQNTGRLRYLAAAVLALALSLAACGQVADEDSITELLVSPSEVALTVDSDEDGTTQLTADFQYESGKTAAAEVNWESNKPEIATVSTEGLVTAVSEGQASVTATATTNSELSGTASIKVAPAGAENPGGGDGDPITVAIDESSLALVRTQTWVLNAEVTGADEGEEGVTWRTSNAIAVSITPEGNKATVTATGTGLATITATSTADPAASASVTVDVTTLEIAIGGFDFDPLAVVQGEDGELTATISNTFPGVDLGVTWSADPTGLIQFGETESFSGVAITFIADMAGTVTVTATSKQDEQVKDTRGFEIESTALDRKNVYVGGTMTIVDAEEGTRFNPFEVIQMGVDAVDEGGTVHLTGDFELTETLNINKDDITLVGAAGHKISPTTSASSSTYLITIPANGVTLDSLNLEVLTGSAFGDSLGLVLLGGHDITIKDSTFTGDWNAGAGLATTALRGQMDFTPWNLVVSGNTFDNMRYPASFYGSVTHRGDVNTSITNNNAIGTKSWLFFGVPEGVTLNGNTFEDSVCVSATAVQISFAPEGIAEIDDAYLTDIEDISVANSDAHVRYLPNGGGSTVYAGTPCYTGG